MTDKKICTEEKSVINRKVRNKKRFLSDNISIYGIFLLKESGAKGQKNGANDILDKLIKKNRICIIKISKITKYG